MSRGIVMASEDKSLGSVLAVVLGVGAGMLLFEQMRRVRTHHRVERQRADRSVASLRLYRAARTLAGCVLCDSAVEHYRGAFHNRSMWAPLVSSTLSVLANSDGARQSVSNHARARRVAHRLAICVGVIGTGFHVYNVAKRSGGLSWQNLFYAAPLGAPAGLTLSGLLGVAAERLRRADPAAGALVEARFGRSLALLASVGLAGTVGEVWLLHLRGSYHNPAMYLPVAVPPIAAISLARSALQMRTLYRGTRRWLRLTAMLGWLGSALHVFGISRAMGGWRNWRQNVLDGPPIPAPPSFSALAAVGLTALQLMEQHGADGAARS